MNCGKWIKGLCGALALGIAGFGAQDAQALLVSGTIGTLSQVDYIHFSVNQAGNVAINALAHEVGTDSGGGITNVDLNGDGDITTLDIHIHLFNDDGSLDVGDFITENDDSSDPAAFSDGSLDQSFGGGLTLDSYLLVNLGVGSYVLAVGAFILDTPSAVAGFNQAGGSAGDYQISITGDGVTDPVVPEPATLGLLSLGLSGLGLLRRRK